MTETVRRPGRLLLVFVCAILLGLTPVGSRPAAAASVVSSATVTSELLGGPDRYATAVAVSKRLFPSGGAAIVYLVSGATFADALAAGPVAARRHGAVLLTAAAGLPAVVEDELTRLAPAKLVVVGGPSVISDATLNRVKVVLGPGTEVARVAGHDRYETASLLVSAAFGAGTADTAFVAVGSAFPDALAAGSAAATLGAPVLLTRTGDLPASTAARLRAIAPSRIVIVGGPAAVSTAVATSLKAIAPTVERVAGTDRYSTAAAVANRFLPDATAIIAATGLTYPDALAAVPLAGSLGAPILLVLPDAVPTST
ncbi:MAG: cell wall-binding repeat-containing protein, partial [Candidatus Limnocylindrales bacterium]